MIHCYLSPPSPSYNRVRGPLLLLPPNIHSCPAHLHPHTPFSLLFGMEAQYMSVLGLHDRISKYGLELGVRSRCRMVRALCLACSLTFFCVCDPSHNTTNPKLGPLPTLLTLLVSSPKSSISKCSTFVGRSINKTNSEKVVLQSTDQ